MGKLWNYIRGNFLYLLEWKIEIRKECRYEKKGLYEYYLKKWYKRKTGEKLNLEYPQTFTEKQQWLKINSVTKLKTMCADKYRVREYVKRSIGEEYLIPTIPLRQQEYFKNAYEICYEELPQTFVIQCNHGAHMTHIVKDKSALPKWKYRILQKRLNEELKINYAYCHGYELQYRDIPPCIFLTAYLESAQDIPDYKFFFFYGKMEFFFVDQDRFGVHKRTVFDSSYELAKFQFDKYPRIEFKIDREVCQRMVQLAQKLAAPFDCVRVDLYCYQGRIYFGELTFSSTSGVKIMKPAEMNYELGKLIVIGKKTIE